MRSTANTFVLLALVLTVMIYGRNAHAKEGYTIKGFVGTSSTEVAANTDVHLLDGKTGDLIDTTSTNFFGKYTFSGLQSGVYFLKAGSVQKEVLVKDRDVRLDIDLSARDGSMNYGKAVNRETPKSLDASSRNPTVPQSATPPNNASFADEIAGTWWGYSGSTERKVGLCVDGSYRDYTESGYSGRSFDSGGNQDMAWGTASQAGGAGTWKIQGDYQQGNIYVTYDNGNQTVLHYQQCGEPGCLLFNGSKLCRTSKSCE